ncbi:hypothetical protein CDAR_453381 [Caerostris darwini]|uniref:Uncharacterized protein n=1 Tax=Caerostris darwini TaxID=1538125 RepID=A0AAV4Q8D0_9ARAC|nr:hypothetical protein CDAR_453381 [Caerostris darwini]
MKMSLPVDYPSHLPFYRVSVLFATTEKPEDLGLDFYLQKYRVHVQENGKASLLKKRILNIDKDNGTLWLNRRIADMDFYNSSQGRGIFNL